jgi:hypothetical protein
MHRGYLGQSQHAYLAGMADCQRAIAAEISADVLVPADRMFYVCAFQSGVERFICHTIHEGAQYLPFLQPRVLSPKGDVEARLSAKVAEAIGTHRLSADEDHDDKLTIVSAFLTSLLGAMAHNAAMLSVMRLPVPAEILQGVGPGLAMPLIQLIAELKPIAESLPVPVSTIDRSNIARFQELLETDTFADYSRSHDALL